jgi:adenosylcobyric acid synthase
MPARALMFQGTGSDVGKSLIVAGVCRAYANRGLKVMPFKPQNMSNNAVVTRENGEIGRAQALQARAARVEPGNDMNPVLLKPQGGAAQVIVNGNVLATASARDYQSLKPRLMAAVMRSFDALRGDADLVLVEGAGSASETNLRANDIANMGFATAANVPVVLIGDIDRVGVIANIVGTRHVVGPADAALIRGFIVNRFRGDPSLFAAGMDEIARLTGWEPFGLVPHFTLASRLPAEDSLALSAKHARSETGGKVRVAVPILPHISNFDDLDRSRRSRTSRSSGFGRARRCRATRVWCCCPAPRRRSPTLRPCFFADDRQRGAWLTRLGAEGSDLDYERQVDDTLDALVEHLAGCIDLDRLLSHAP